MHLTIEDRSTDQEELHKIVSSKVKKHQLDFTIPNIPATLQASITWPNGKVVRTKYMVSGNCCFSSGYIVCKTIIKISGEIYDMYNSEAVLGAGGFGKVFVAKNLRTNQFYPVKSSINEDISREYSALSALGLSKGWAQVADPCGLVYTKEKSFPSIHGYNQNSFIVMQYLGRTLQDYFRHNKYQKVDSFTTAIEMAICVTKMHLIHGIAHLDIKPSNMFYRPEKRKGEKIEFGDFGTVARANKKVHGYQGTEPYVIFDKPYVNTKISANDRDIVVMLRCLTGVSEDNSSETSPKKYAHGILDLNTLVERSLYDFLFINPSVLKDPSYKPPKALTITARLIVAQYTTSEYVHDAINSRDGLAARILCNYYAEDLSEDIWRDQIESWTHNPEPELEGNFLLLVRLNLDNKALSAINSQDLMDLITDSDVRYEHKVAAALLFKLGIFSFDNQQKLSELGSEELKLFLKAYNMKKWDEFSEILHGDVKNIDPTKLSGGYSTSTGSDSEPYFNSEDLNLEQYENENKDLLLWIRDRFLKTYGTYDGGISSVKIDFHWGVLHKTLYMNPSFYKVMQWLKSLEPSEYLDKFILCLLDQQTNINIAKIILQLKDDCSLKQLSVLFDFELRIYDWLYHEQIDSDALPYSNFKNIIVHADFLKGISQRQVPKVIDYFIFEQNIPAHVFAVDVNLLNRILVTKHIYTDVYECMRVKLFVDACAQFAKITEIDSNVIAILARDVKRGYYQTCELIASQELSQNPYQSDQDNGINPNKQSIHEIQKAASISKIYYQLLDKFPNQASLYEQHASLRLIILNISRFRTRNQRYTRYSKEILNIFKILLQIYESLGKLESATDISKLCSKLEAIANDFDENFSCDLDDLNDFMELFAASINDYILDAACIRRFKEYDKQHNLSGGLISRQHNMHNIFSTNGISAVAKKIRRLTSDLDKELNKIPKVRIRINPSSVIPEELSSSLGA
ncbi:MAG: AarF/UbiB family protein [Legionellaceae bacterium]|nr:AarF/UbiB family protein [Legionellaceae bacterium]